MDSPMSFSAFDDIEVAIDVLSVPIFVMDVDADSTIRFAKLNKAHVAAVGLPSAAVEGKTPHECLPPRVAETILTNFHACIASRSSRAYEEVLDLARGEAWWQTTLSPVFDESGKVMRIIGIATDITERKMREFEALKAHNDLEAVNDHMAFFTSMTAHDVRGSLGKVKILTEIIMEGNDVEETARIVAMCHSVAEKGLDYVDSVLGYAKALKIESAPPSQIDLGHVVRDMAALVDPEGRFEIELPQIRLKGEIVALQMIMRNLIENASRHAGGRISVTTSPAPGNPGFMYFVVADDGTGFPGGAEAFRRRLHLQTNDIGTRGFGISAVRHLIETRGGTVDLVAPVYETGTAIAFTFPGEPE